MKTSLHLNYLKQDPSGEIRFLFGKLYNTVYPLLTTLVSKANLLLGGGKYGPGLKARGLISVQHHHNW